MSLSVDGTWKAGVWDQTVWASGVWYEGSPVQPTVIEQPKITAAGGGGQRIHRNNDFIIHKHEPKPYVYPFKRNMEARDRQDIADLLAMLADSDLLH